MKTLTVSKHNMHMLYIAGFQIVINVLIWKCAKPIIVFVIDGWDMVGPLFCFSKVFRKKNFLVD